jgi:toxin ParE1/3/4
LPYPVVFSELAIDDLAEIAVWIAQRAGKQIAHAYVERLKAFALRIGGYPHGGTPRDEFAPGLRSVTFERRYVIIYRTDNASVEVMRIISGYRNLGPILGS